MAQCLLCTGANNLMLPLERHVRKHEENIRKITDQLQSKNRELECFDSKLSYACHQNGGRLIGVWQLPFKGWSHQEIMYFQSMKVCIHMRHCRKTQLSKIDSDKSDKRSVETRERTEQSDT